MSVGVFLTSVALTCNIRSSVTCWKKTFYCYNMFFQSSPNSSEKKLRMYSKKRKSFPHYPLKFKFFVTLMKSLFIIDASCFSSDMSSPVESYKFFAESRIKHVKKF